MMTLRQIAETLRQARPDAQVFFSLNDIVPTTLRSWRGVYAEPAIGYCFQTYEKPAPSVKEVLADFDEALAGRVFLGYKGGEFKFTGASGVHVANYGQVGYAFIAKVNIIHESRVEFVLGFEES